MFFKTFSMKCEINIKHKTCEQHFNNVLSMLNLKMFYKHLIITGFILIILKTFWKCFLSNYYATFYHNVFVLIFSECLPSNICKQR